MRALDFIIGFSWIVFWLYWIISALSSKKSMRHGFGRYVRIRLLVIALALILFFGVPHAATTHALGTSTLALVIGFLLFIAGAAFAIWARRHLGKNWGMPMTQKEKPELVTSGPYKYVRHPIYAGLILMALGSAIDVNVYWLLVFIVFGLFFIYSAVVEEETMTKQFPKTYPKYKATTKMLIPFVF